MGCTIIACYWWCGDGKDVADTRLFLVHNIKHAYVDCANIHRARDLFEQALDQLVSSNTFASGNDEIEWDSDGEDVEESLHDYADVCGRNRSSSGPQEAQAQENQVKNDNSMNVFQQDKETRMKSNINNATMLENSGVGISSNLRCDKVSTFLQLVKKLSKPEAASYFVFDNAEKLLSLGSSIFSIFSRIQEVTGGNFGVIMITQSAWESFEDDAAGTIPLSLHIHPNQPSQIIDLVCEECPPDDDESLFQNFVRDAHSVFRSMISNVRELRYVVQLLYPRYRQLCNESNMDFDGNENVFLARAKIQRQMQPLYRMVQRRLLLHDINEDEIEEFSTQKKKGSSPLPSSNPSSIDRSTEAIVTTNDSDEHGDYSASCLVSSTNETSNEAEYRRRALSSAIELPMLTKFLLIAAYLASHNPADTDVKIFTHHRSGRRRKRRSHQTSEPKTSTRDKLKFPKQFPTERMYAIFF